MSLGGSAFGSRPFGDPEVDAGGGGGDITGSLVTTEVGSDTAAMSGVILVQGSLVASEVGSDTFTSNGTVLVRGSLAASEVGNDNFVASGAVIVQGSLVATEVGADTFLATGGGVVTATGTLVATEVGPDTASIVGIVAVQGSFAASEVGVDTAAGTGFVILTGNLTASEVGVDTFASFGLTVAITGAVAASEVGSDTFLAEGIPVVLGSLAATEVGSDTTANPTTTLKYHNGNQWVEMQLTNIAQSRINSGTMANMMFVSDLSDLPAPQSGVITLLDGYTYYFTTIVDLRGNRLVSGINTTILGSSSENCRIKSTGLTGTALLSSNYSLPMRGITLEADVALNLNGDGVTTALDWFGVNFTDCNTVGTIANYSNFIMTDCALLNSAGMVLDGSIGTVGFNSSLFSGRAGQTTITIPATATISRRFRIIYSAFVTPPTGTALDVSASASIPVEGYILDTVNHGGGGTAIAGVPFTDNKALFLNCRGISNSAQLSNYYMSENAVVTDIVTQGVPVKAAGTTSSSPITQKFTNTDNRATYTGALSRSFKVSAVATVTASAQALQVGFYVAKNGSVLTESEIYATTNTSNRAENVSIQCIVDLDTSDYIEVFVENSTNNTDVTITFLNVIVEALN